MKKAEEYVEGNNLFDDFFLKEELSGRQIRGIITKVIKKVQIDTAEYVARKLTTTALKNQSILDVIDEIKKEIL